MVGQHPFIVSAASAAIAAPNRLALQPLAPSTPRSTDLAVLGGRSPSRRFAGEVRWRPQIVPTVFNRALGWISFWLITGVWPRKRSMIERT